MYARAKIKNATNSAPHIWRNVREKTSPITLRLGRRIARMMSQEAKVDVPPLSGLKLKVEESVPCVTDDLAVTASFSQLIPGRGDLGFVHPTTTRISTMYGSHANKASRTDPISAEFEVSGLGDTRAPRRIPESFWGARS